MSLPTLLTTAQAAERLQVKEGTLREYQRRGLLPYLRLGRQIRYDAADLTAWLDTIRGAGEAPDTGGEFVIRPCDIDGGASPATLARKCPFAGCSMIGTAGFEPATPCSQSRCATRLRHAPCP